MPRLLMLLSPALVLTAALGFRFADADDEVFSGPQSGEKLASFKAVGVFDKAAGKEFDLVERADGKPLLIIFVHEITRPSVATLRAVTNYASKLADKGVRTGLVFLSDDKTAMEERLKRARHALPKNVPVGISVDGAEGPGAYGLNRKMTLTVLVAKDGKVTANFALVQPSVQTDAPKIAAALAKAAGVEPPTARELAALSGVGRPAPARGEMPAELATLLRAVINKDNQREDVEAAAKKLETYLKDKPAEKKRVGDIARRIIDAGKLENYGTAKAQEYLKEWAKKYGVVKKNEK